MKFKQFISERFLNLFDADLSERERYAEDVFELLQDSYSYIGGIKGSGFESAQDMIELIPLWKLVRLNDEIVAAALYKDIEGRKRVEIASDGTPEAKKRLAEIVKDDMKQSRAYGEISGSSVGFSKRQVSDFVQFVITPEEASKIINNEEIRYPVSKDDPEVIKHPELADYFYQRNIGGEWKTKIMTGTPFVGLY